MATRGEIVGAVDFGSREIRVLIARADEDGSIQVLGCGVASGRGCVSQGVIQDLKAAQIAFRSAITKAEKEARARVDSVFCGVNGRNVETFIREGQARMEREVVEESHMAEAHDIASRDILAPGQKIISSVSAEEWYVDELRVADPLGIRGQILKTRVHFARLPAVIRDNISLCIESQHRELEDMVFMPLAASMGCLTAEDIELGVAVLDVGRSTTGLAVRRDYRILGTHCFDWGAYQITRDVAAGLQISFDEADELILEYGVPESRIQSEFGGDQDPDPARTKQGGQPARIKLRTSVPGAPAIMEREELDTIVYERAKEILVRVRQMLNARGLSKNLVRGMVLTGGASLIKNFPALAEGVFQVPCRIGYPNLADVTPHQVESPAFSGAVGIIRHGVEYRAAARNGRVDGRGPARSWVKRTTRFMRKYFF